MFPKNISKFGKFHNQSDSTANIWNYHTKNAKILRFPLEFSDLADQISSESEKKAEKRLMEKQKRESPSPVRNKK